MPYVMENRNDAYVSVSGLGNFGAEIQTSTVAMIKAAIRKLQGLVGAGTDGKWGSSTQTKFVAWLRRVAPETVRPAIDAVPENTLNPAAMNFLLSSKGGMSAVEIANANLGWVCWNNPGAFSNCSVLKNGAAPAPAATAARSDTPAAWMTTGPVAEEEELSFFDKYWWLIAVGALGVGGFVFWRMKREAGAA
jgi:hypothetical protein